MRDEILSFLASQPLCTVASVNGDGKPEAALVGFSHTDDLRLYFGTSKLTRKYKNLLANLHVAIVVADFTAEVQYEGMAAEVVDEVRKKEITARHFQKVPGAEKFLNDENQVYFEITPAWLRFIRHGEHDMIEEMTEF